MVGAGTSCIGRGASCAFPLPLGEGLEPAERQRCILADPKGGAKPPKGEGRAFPTRSDPHPFAQV